MRKGRFHGRFESGDRPCEVPGCLDPGEFRAPGERPAGFDGPGDYRWFCLEHVRAFNAGYDWFEGMTLEEIDAAQAPAAGWANQARAFRPDAGVDGAPRWGDFEDPLDAIAARMSGGRKPRGSGWRSRGPLCADDLRFSRVERDALEVMELPTSVQLGQLRRRYAELVRRYHPDRNGGDRRHERLLQRVVQAYQLLRRADAFAEP